MSATCAKFFPDNAVKANLLPVMRTSALDSLPWRQSSYVCSACLPTSWAQFKTLLAAAAQKRHITQNFLRKKEAAREQWKMWAQEIRDGKKESYLKVLEQRGWVNNIAGYACLKKPRLISDSEQQRPQEARKTDDQQAPWRVRRYRSDRTCLAHGTHGSANGFILASCSWISHCLVGKVMHLLYF